LKKLILGKKSRIFNKRIYEITNGEEFKKDFDLVRQIRRASISISSNIAEGFERKRIKEFIYFLTLLKHIFCRSKITIVFSIGFKLYYKMKFENYLRMFQIFQKLNWIYKIFK
jgi:hypothetical protein